MSRIKSPLVLGLALSTFLSFMAVTLPSSQASTPKPGSSCSKVGLTSISSGKKFTCIKSGKRLVWSKGLAPAPTPATAPAPTPTLSTTPAMYVAKDQKTVHHLIANEGCANPSNATARLQVLVNGVWLPISVIKSGWVNNQPGCPVSQLGKKDSLAWADVYLDPGVTFRWYFTGEVNILHRDNLGNGYSADDSLQPLVIPHPVENSYGLTWENIAARVPDISAAAYTDAQATIARNSSLPGADVKFTIYISPGAAQLYPQVENGPNMLKRTFALYAKYPHAPQAFYVATTMEEKDQTFAKIDQMYPSSPFMKDTLNAIYGINTNLPAGSVYTHASCAGSDSGRNTSDWKQAMIASAVVWNFCPLLPGNPQSHIESDHGVPHEYTHDIQNAIYGLTSNKLIPCWMKEGEAEWTQTAVSPSFSEYLEMQHFHPYYLSSNGLNYSTPTQTTWSASEISDYFKEAIVIPCNTTPRQAMSYSAGAAGIEALVAIGGSESFFGIDQRIAIGESFQDAFKEVYGVTWDYALPILSEVVAQKLTHANMPDAITYQTRPA